MGHVAKSRTVIRKATASTIATPRLQSGEIGGNRQFGGKLNCTAGSSAVRKNRRSWGLSLNTSRFRGRWRVLFWHPSLSPVLSGEAVCSRDATPGDSSCG
jgi:hypothetical protein